MELETGQVVMAKAGRDKGLYFAVVGFEQGCPLLANGRERRLEKPKLKKPKHINPTCKVLPLPALATNNKIHKALRLSGFAATAPGLPEQEEKTIG